jgi:hypothetical protein
MAKNLDDIARLMAAGFRSMKLELQAQRRAIEQTQIATVEYHRSSEDRDGLKGERLGKLETDVRELQRKAAE